MSHRDFKTKNEGREAEIDLVDMAGQRQLWPMPANDQIGDLPENSAYPDTVKLLKADNTDQPLGGDEADIGAASTGQGRRE